MHITTPMFIFATTIAAHQLEQRQATTSAPPSPFSANAAQLISLYIPTSVQSLLYSVYTSVESTTGNPASIIESAFTATTPPPWLDAVPTAYKSNIEALESAISSLRVAATGGVGATVAPATTATTALESSRATTTRSPSSSSGESTSESSSGSTSASESSTASEVSAAGTQATISFDWGSATQSSSGFAQPTQVPVAVAGILGIIGAVFAL